MQTLCPKTLAAALTRITTDKTMIEKAADIGVQIRSENGVDRAVESIYDEMEYSRRTVIMSRFAEKTG